MLTRELAIASYERGRILPDRLTARRHAHYRAYAEAMVELYRQGAGRTRRELHQAVRGVFADEPECPIRRIDAFCKLLDDASVYWRDMHGHAAKLRRSVFRRAAPLHPLVRTPDRLFDHAEAQIKEAIAGELGLPWSEIEGNLFADVMEFHRLKEMTGFADGAALLSRYNVAQVQAALYGALRMTVWATQDFKTILRFAKLAGLLHEIRREAEGRYVIRFDGPASVLRHTRRYGVALARFLPALLACRGWRMHAQVETRRTGWTVGLELSPADGLKSHLPAPEEFDSGVESAFAEKWGSEPRDGWTMVREGEVLYHDQKVFVPDFFFRHADGREVLLEIVGFWTPEYLTAKAATLRAFRDRKILLAVAEAVAGEVPDLAAEAIRFKTALKLQSVLDRLAQVGR